MDGTGCHPQIYQPNIDIFKNNVDFSIELMTDFCEALHAENHL